MATIPVLDIPQMSWDVVKSRVNQYWQAREAPHISIMAQTRAGKSYLVRHGLLPLCRHDRVLFVDVKGNDRTINGLGRPVRRIPTKLHRVRQLWRGEQPEDNWFRLVVFDDPRRPDIARNQVEDAFMRVRDDGDWVVVLDELRAITDPQAPGLHLKNWYEYFVLRGGSNGIATISCSQEPRWCPGSFYTQSNFYFFSRLEDEATHKRLAEVGSTKAILPHIQTIPRRHFLYMDNMDDDGERFWAKTKVA